jgi:hypothetical protein
MLGKAGAILAAVILSAAMWFWVQKILIPHQEAHAAEEGIPRGNLSDLYPRWLGTRELLLHGRDPYGADITREIQTGYYGRPLDASRPHDPKDQQAFAYPVYVAFVLAPVVNLPFPEVQRGFLWLLILITAASVPLWLRALGWRVSGPVMILWVVLTLGWLPTIQGFKLQQLTLLVAGLLAGSLGAVAAGHLVLAGVLLAVASIKPQLVALPAAMLLIWSLGDWRQRQRLVWGFGGTMLVLFAGGEFLLPGWPAKFRAASAAYWQYTGGGKSVLDIELTPTPGRVVAALLVAALFYFAWRLRRAETGSADFGWLMALTMATTILVIPMVAPYNQVLLLPALMVLARAIPPLRRTSRPSRLLVLLTAASVFWPWLIALFSLAALPFLPATMVEKAWSVPWYTTFFVPTLTLGVVFLGRKAIRAAG